MFRVTKINTTTKFRHVPMKLDFKPTCQYKSTEQQQQLLLLKELKEELKEKMKNMKDDMALNDALVSGSICVMVLFGL